MSTRSVSETFPTAHTNKNLGRALSANPEKMAKLATEFATENIEKSIG